MVEVSIDELCAAGIAELQTGPFGSQLHAHDYVLRGVPVVPTEAIRDRRIDHEKLPRIKETKAKELARHRLRTADILFARRGVQATGQSAFVRQEEEGFICGTGAIRLRLTPANGKVLPGFLSHVLMSPSAIAWIRHNAIGATMPNLNEGIIRRFRFSAPTVPDQEAIAGLLDALDDKIELNRRMNETLETMARAIFKDWFVDFGPSRAKAEGRAPYLAPEIWSLFPDRLDDDDKPAGWGEKRVEDILELAYGKALTGSERAQGMVPVYGSGGVTGYHNEALVSGPSVVVGRKGTVGSLYWEDRPFFPIDTVFYVIPKAPLSFCFYHLQTLSLGSMNTDAAVPGLNRSNVYRLPVPWGPDALRQSFDEMVTPLRKRIAANSDESATLAALRDLLLPKLMSGEIRVKDAEKAVGEAA